VVARWKSAECGEAYPPVNLLGPWKFARTSHTSNSHGEEDQESSETPLKPLLTEITAKRAVTRQTFPRDIQDSKRCCPAV
jgi:hypothetical protein